MKAIRKIRAISLFVLIVASMTSTIAGQTATGIKFSELVTFEEQGDLLIGRITAAAVGPDKKVYLGDNDQKQVHVFDDSGRYLKSFGREGNGPGEFSMINRIAVQGTTIHVFDMLQQRISRFNTEDLRFRNSISLADPSTSQQTNGSMVMARSRASEIHVLPNGDYLVPTRDFSDPDAIKTSLYGADGSLKNENLVTFRGGQDMVSRGNTRIIANLPFMRMTRISVSPTGLIHTNWSETVEIHHYDLNGKKTSSFTHATRNKRLNRSEVIEMMQNVQTTGTRVTFGGGGGVQSSGPPPIEQMLQNFELPDTWPAVTGIFADALDRTWVSSFSDDLNNRTWYLFEKNGRLLGIFEWPMSKTVVHADREYAWVLDRRQDDLDRVIKMKIELTGSR